MIKLKDLTPFEKTVLLLYANSSHRGPGMVVKNLTKGLEHIGLQYSSYDVPKASEMIGVLQYCHPKLLNSYHQMNESVLMGPNLFVLPTDNPSLCKMFNNFVVPSQWVKDLYFQFDLMKDKNIEVWPVGIDTDEWPTYPNMYCDMKGEEPDCFIYFKNRSEQDLAIVEAICRKFGLKYKTIKYGSYDESELKVLSYNSKFAILCTGTESQGIAYMQILSTNTPCYVFNSPTWKSEDGQHSCPASSVPYWDERCGYKTDKVDLEHFKDFLNKIENKAFSPREYIIENYTLEKAAKNYYNLLRRAYGKDPVEF